MLFAACAALLLTACLETGSDGEEPAPGSAVSRTAAATGGPGEWAARHGTPEPGSVRAMGCDKVELTVRDIDDPENPYRGMYREYDYWCFGNANPDDALLMAYYTGAGPEGYQVTNAVVDSDGFIVPHLEIYRFNILGTHEERSAEWARADYPYLDLEKLLIHEEGDDCMRSFRAGGQIPPEVTADFEAAICGILAPYVPRVPEWLAAAPPMLVLLMADGEVAAYGEPGSNDGGLTGLPAAETEGEHPWIRYDAAGVEINRLEPGHSWVELYFDGFAALRGERESRGERVLVQSGLVLVLDPDEDGILALYDHHGTSLEPSPEAASTRELPYEELPGRLLGYLYAAQRDITGADRENELE